MRSSMQCHVCCWQSVAALLTHYRMRSFGNERLCAATLARYVASLVAAKAAPTRSSQSLRTLSGGA